MNEIPKNSPSVPQQQKVEPLKAEVIQEPVQQLSVETQTKEIKEIPENPADRSAVKIDSLENDMKIFTSNPELASRALEVAELAQKRYADAGVENPELKALAVGKAFVEEFQK